MNDEKSGTKGKISDERRRDRELGNAGSNPATREVRDLDFQPTGTKLFFARGLKK